MLDRVKSIRLLQTVKSPGKDQPLTSYSFLKRELLVVHPDTGDLPAIPSGRRNDSSLDGPSPSAEGHGLERR